MVTPAEALDAHFRELLDSDAPTSRPEPVEAVSDGGSVGVCPRPGDQPAAGLRCPRAAGGRAGLLHHRLRRPREQRAGGAGAAAAPIRRCCTTAPAAFYCARAAQVPGSTPIRDVLQGADGVWPPSRSPAGGTRCSATRRWRSSRRPRPSPPTCRARSGWPSRCTGHAGSASTPRVARRRRGGVLLRRRLGQPLHRHRRDQHRAQRRLPRAAGPDPVRLRGQRSGHLGADPDRLDRGRVRIPAGTGRTWRSTAADPVAAWPVITEAVAAGRGTRRPVFLHLRTVRFLGHAGSDAEVGYRRAREIDGRLRPRSAARRRPRVLVAVGASSRRESWRCYDAIREQVDAEAESLLGGDRLGLRRTGDGPAGPPPTRDAGRRAAPEPVAARSAAPSRGPWPRRSTPPSRDL